MTTGTARPSRASARRVGAIVGLVLVAVAGRARAQPAAEIQPHQPHGPDGTAPWRPPVAPPPLPPAPVTAKRWYGYQIMLADVASIVVAANGQQAAIVGTIGFFAAPALVHGIQRNGPMVVASPLLRMGLALVGAYIGVAAASCSYNSKDNCEVAGALRGAAVGLGTAMILDYLLAWYEPTPARVSSTPSPPRPRLLSLSSAGVAPIANGAAVVLGASF